jgi:lipopolysaccharide export LptBFGC system permease protein LptF
VERYDRGLDRPNGAATLALPIGTVESNSGHSLARSVWFIWFVLFIWLVWFNQTNQIDKRNQPEVAHWGAVIFLLLSLSDCQYVIPQRG